MVDRTDAIDAHGGDTDAAATGATETGDDVASADGTEPNETVSDAGPDPLLRRDDEIEYETVDAAAGLSKGVLIGEAHGAPTFALRRFVLDPGAEVPKHTNEVEHEQYVLAGEYVVGIGDTERTVEAGDSLFIPAGAVHWYRNESTSPGAFLCAVPNGDDEIRLASDGA